MTKLKYLILTSVLAGLLAACGSGEEHYIQEIAPIHAKVGIATVSSEKETIQVSGRIEAGNSANVSTRMMGSISQMLVNPGDEVKKGDLLLVISSADLRAKKAQVEASIEQARSALKNAQKDHERFTVLYEKGSASAKELENITTRYEMAEAGLEVAQQMKKEVDAQFAYTNLRAPFSGIVANTFVKVGDIANPGMPLATVEGTSAYEAAVMVPESQISRIKMGASANILIKSRNISISGKVTELSPSAKNTGGQFLAKIDLQGSKDILPNILPGMFINAVIKVDQGVSIPTSPMVDEKALIRTGQLTGIYALGNDDTAILRWVRIGQERSGQVEILSGISEGEKYIMKPEGKLFNGAKVLLNK